MKFINSDRYPIVKASEMSKTELSNWFAFCNAIKFFSLHCKRKGINPDSVELDSREVSKYVDRTAGDIETWLTHKNGIPMKFSLDSSSEESRVTEELTYN